MNQTCGAGSRLYVVQPYKHGLRIVMDHVCFLKWTQNLIKKHKRRKTKMTTFWKERKNTSAAQPDTSKAKKQHLSIRQAGRAAAIGLCFCEHLISFNDAV